SGKTLVAAQSAHELAAGRVLDRRIAPYSLTAAPLWAGAEAGAGYAATASLQHTLALGSPALAAAAACAAAAMLWTKTRRTRLRSAVARAAVALDGVLQPSDQIGHWLRRGRDGGRPPASDAEAYKQRITAASQPHPAARYTGLSAAQQHLLGDLADHRHAWLIRSCADRLRDLGLPHTQEALQAFVGAHRTA
ncbi:hypothetical protein ACFRC1_41595, partial [Streptomyces sp. NPDC056626]